MKIWSLILLSAVLVLGARPAAAAGPRLLTDEELDQVSAGGVSFNLSVDPSEQAVDFAFNLGSSLGDLRVAVGTPTQVPSTTVFNGNGGNVNLSNASFLVDNMIFNLNICVQCRADTIIQKGLGVPITIRANP